MGHLRGRSLVLDDALRWTLLFIAELAAAARVRDQVVDPSTDLVVVVLTFGSCGATAAGLAQPLERLTLALSEAVRGARLQGLLMLQPVPAAHISM